jgi:hypothetical protein
VSTGILYSAEFKNERRYTSAPLYAFMAWTGTTLPLDTSYVKYAYCELDVLTHWHLFDFVYSKCIKVKFSCA